MGLGMKDGQKNVFEIHFNVKNEPLRVGNAYLWV